MPTANGTLPKLLLIQPRNVEHDAYRNLNNVAPFTTALKRDFNVVQHEGNEDPFDLLEKHSPDLVIYDTSCLQASQETPPHLTRKRAFNNIPVAALIVDDAHDPDKPNKLQLCDRLGAEAFFCVDSAMLSYTADFKSKVILYPWFVNDELYKDYDLDKDIPIGLFGYGFKNDPTDNRYPWRREITNEILGQLPFITYPRPDKKTPHELVGEQYARMINRCQMAFSCGGVRGVFVKKMLEIPASGTCLVTEDSAIVREMGFVDEENCLMVNKQNVVDKCKHYLNNPRALEAITQKGHELVSSNHTISNRNQVAQWFELRRHQGSAITVHQPSALKPLQADNTTTSKPTQLKDTSRFHTLLQTGITALKNGKLKDAKAAFCTLEEHIDFACEVRYYLTLTYLLLGDKKNYKKRIKRFKNEIEDNSHFTDPAIASVVLLGLDSLGKKSDLKRIFEKVRHIEHPFFDATAASLKLPRAPSKIGQLSCFEYPGSDIKQVQHTIAHLEKQQKKFSGILRFIEKPQNKTQDSEN